MRALPAVAALLLGLLALAPRPANADPWGEIDPADLQLTKPRVTPDADAEALLWEITVEDALRGDLFHSRITHYLRIKVFNDRGRDSQSRVDIPYGEGVEIEDLAARTIRPDGSRVDLKGNAIFDRVIAKGQGVKIRAKSLAFPAVETGSILEYRWTYSSSGRLTHNLKVDLQRDIPVETIHLRVKPFVFPDHEYAMRMQAFNAEVPKSTPAADGFLETTMKDMPAFVEEPFMPPERQSKAWVAFYYASRTQPTPAEFWNDIGIRAYNESAIPRQVTRDLKAEARAAVRDAAVPEAELGTLCEFCRAKIRNISDDASGLTDTERSKIPENRSPEETLKRATGTADDINELFATLATALGADARLVYLADRRESLFSRDRMLVGELSRTCVAVHGYGTWNFFDPGDPHVPCGMLPWWEQGEDALMTDEAAPWFETTPLSSPELSLTKCTATLRLEEDGTLEGDARSEYWGLAGASVKEEYDDVSAAAREESVREGAKARLGGADITQIAMEHIQDSVFPVVVSYHVRAPRYAQKTGTRIFLEPAYFEHGRAAYFPTRDRRYAISFPYPWHDQDSLTIALPPGWEIEAADLPAPIESADLGRYESRLRAGAGGDRLTFQRSLVVAGKGAVALPRETYPALKDFFDRVREADGRLVSLRARGGKP